jgi:hypothetical protein
MRTPNSWKTPRKDDARKLQNKKGINIRNYGHEEGEKMKLA